MLAMLPKGADDVEQRPNSHFVTVSTPAPAAVTSLPN